MIQRLCYQREASRSVLPNDKDELNKCSGRRSERSLGYIHSRCKRSTARGVRTKAVRSSGEVSCRLRSVTICGSRRVGGEGGPIVLPISVEAVDPKREHVLGVLDAPPGAGELQALLHDVAMRAFDFAPADRQPFGQRLAVFPL